MYLCCLIKRGNVVRQLPLSRDGIAMRQDRGVLQPPGGEDARLARLRRRQLKAAPQVQSSPDLVNVKLLANGHMRIAGLATTYFSFRSKPCSTGFTTEPESKTATLA